MSDWTVQMPPASISLRQPTDLNLVGGHGPLVVGDVTASPDDSYCFTVTKDRGLPIVTFCFRSFDYAVSAARQMITFLPHIVRCMNRRR